MNVEIPGLEGRPIADGEIHRYARERRGKKNCWYVLHQEGDKYWGAYGDWKTGERTSIREGALTRAQVARSMELVNRKRDDDGRQAAFIAELQWSEAEPLGLVLGDQAHPYLARKHVLAYGLRRHGNRLLVPMRWNGESLRGLQSVYPDGTKLYTKGCAKQGCYHQILGDVFVVVAEGYATAASIHMATGATCLVAFDAGNLLPVAQAYRALHPAAHMVVAADFDHSTACDRHKREAHEAGIDPVVHDPRRPRPAWCRCNPGLTAAIGAARAVGARLAIPNLGGVEGTDFNDIHVARGLDAVTEQIYGVL